VTLSTSEIDSLRFHLGYGNLTDNASLYTADGFQMVFEQVISPNLSTGTEDASTTAVVAGSTTVITLTDASEFVIYSKAMIDVGDDAEIVVVKAQVTGGPETITAKFAKAHGAAGYPVATMSGKARLRFMLSEAERLWEDISGKSVTATAGIKSIGRGQVEWFANGSALRSKVKQYQELQRQIATLCRVAPDDTFGKGSCSLSLY